MVKIKIVMIHLNIEYNTIIDNDYIQYYINFNKELYTM